MKYSSHSHEFFLDSLLLLKENIIAEIAVTISKLKSHRRLSKNVDGDGWVNVFDNENGIWINDWSQIERVSSTQFRFTSEQIDGGDDNLENLDERILIEILKYLQHIS